MQAFARKMLGFWFELQKMMNSHNQQQPDWVSSFLSLSDSLDPLEEKGEKKNPKNFKKTIELADWSWRRRCKATTQSARVGKDWYLQLLFLPLEIIIYRWDQAAAGHWYKEYLKKN